LSPTQDLPVTRTAGHGDCWWSASAHVCARLQHRRHVHGRDGSDDETCGVTPRSIAWTGPGCSQSLPRPHAVTDGVRRQLTQAISAVFVRGYQDLVTTSSILSLRSSWLHRRGARAGEPPAGHGSCYASGDRRRSPYLALTIPAAKAISRSTTRRLLTQKPRSKPLDDRLVTVIQNVRGTLPSLVHG
jgi:hypothetical protein